MSWTLLLFVAYLALLVWAMRSRTRELKGPWWFFLRAFFPNWKFYHSVGRPPRLYVKGRLPDGSWTDWQLLYPRHGRKLWHLFHNARVNLALNHQNLVDHLAYDINELPEGGDLTHCVSYRLVSRWAQQSLAPHVQAYQFELRLEPTPTETVHIMLQSPVLAR
ncbi:MAG: hypothetical protein RI949_2719 [Pseudomonadota bacterium]|jgi:hypothetical protein|nr:hypothetical protein [Betaproteobacteria bacterium]